MNQHLFDMNGKLCGPELDRRAALCEECMSETCAFNPEGVCVFPLICGREAEIVDDGCRDWIYSEEVRGDLKWTMKK